MKSVKDIFLLFCLSFVLGFTSCQSELKNQSSSEVIAVTSSAKNVSLDKPTLIVISLNEEQLEEIKTLEGEDIFYTVTDDLLFYHHELLQKMDSLKIPVLNFDSDTLTVQTNKFTQTIIKDSTFSIFNYFLFNGEVLEEKDLWELLSEN